MRKGIFVLLWHLPVFLFAQREVYLDTLQPFWRNQPVLGPHLQDGLWLYKVPEYFFNTSFSYKSRPHEKEVLFADHLTVVRLLGGYDNYPGVVANKITGVNTDGTMKVSQLSTSDLTKINELSKYDFVYRKKDGSLGFRPDLIKDRLAPYIQSGYTDFTIVLDNIPWALVEVPKIGSFGQVAPPDSKEEWYLTVTELCKVLKTILGDRANRLRFRIGTEMNGKERFDGTEEQFMEHYATTYSAIQKELPKAGLSLYNIGGASLKGIKRLHNVNTFHVIKTLNTTKPSHERIPFPFIAFSRYFYEKNNLIANANGLNTIWNYISDSLSVRDFSKEIHEFGPIADWNADLPTGNPGAFGNAMALQVIIDLYTNGLDRLFHWNLLDGFYLKNKDVIHIPHAQIWSYSILEHMVGGNAYRVNDIHAERNDSTNFRALLSVFDDKAYLLVNVFHPDRNKQDAQALGIRFSKNLLPFEVRRIESASFTNQNSIHYNIRKDAERLGILSNRLVDKKNYIPRYLNRDFFENPQAGQMLVEENMDKYQVLWRDAFMLEKFNGSCQEIDGLIHLNFSVATPQSMVIVFD